MNGMTIEQRLHECATKFEYEREILETALDTEYFDARKGEILAAMREMESTREIAVTLMGKGLVRDIAAEAGRLENAFCVYGDSLVHLNDALTLERDRSEQYIRQQVQGPMSGNFDDFYEMHARLNKGLSAASQLETFTAEMALPMQGLTGSLGNAYVKLLGTLREIGKARTALEEIARVQLAIVRTRLAAVLLEKAFSELRVQLEDGRIAITEEKTMKHYTAWVTTVGDDPEVAVLSDENHGSDEEPVWRSTSDTPIFRAPITSNTPKEFGEEAVRLLNDAGWSVQGYWQHVDTGFVATVTR